MDKSENGVAVGGGGGGENEPGVDGELTDVVVEVLGQHGGSCLDNDPERNALTIALVEQLTHWFYMRQSRDK